MTAGERRTLTGSAGRVFLLIAVLAAFGMILACSSSSGGADAAGGAGGGSAGGGSGIGGEGGATSADGSAVLTCPGR